MSPDIERRLVEALETIAGELCALRELVEDLVEIELVRPGPVAPVVQHPASGELRYLGRMGDVLRDEGLVE